MDARIEVQWCVACGARFTAEEVVGATCCPKCGSTGLPCAAQQDLVVEINWHELRILGIWASNYARAQSEDCQRSLRGILSRLERQAPALPPLTIAGELRLLRATGAQVTGTNIGTEGLVVVHGPGAVGHGRPALQHGECMEAEGG